MEELSNGKGNYYPHSSSTTSIYVGVEQYLANQTLDIDEVFTIVLFNNKI